MSSGFFFEENEFLSSTKHSHDAISVMFLMEELILRVRCQNGITLETPLRCCRWLLLLFEEGAKQSDGAAWSTWRGCMPVAMPMLPGNKLGSGGLCLVGAELAPCRQR